MKITFCALMLLLASMISNVFAQDDYDVSSEEVVPVVTPTPDYTDSEIAPPPTDGSDSTYIPEESSESVEY